MIWGPHAAPLADSSRLDDGVVARPPTGQLIERAGKNGRTFSARIRAYGERHYVRFGHSRDGWTRAKAEAELANILADVRRGLWVPEPATSIPEPPKREPTFHEFASEWFDRAKRELRANTVSAYEYEITHHLLPFSRSTGCPRSRWRKSTGTGISRFASETHCAPPASAARPSAGAHSGTR